MIEVELKFEITAEARVLLLATLDALPGARRFDSTPVLDTYYDTTHFACLQQAVFIRIRNQALLEIKYHEQADPEHAHSTESVFPLAAEPSQVSAMNNLCTRFLPAWQPAASIEEALRYNDLRPFVHIEKKRTLYTYKNMSLCVDHVDRLGDFFEVETLCADASQVAQTQAQLHAFIAHLACPTLRPVHLGYVELWLRVNLPQVYRLGKYQAEMEVEQSNTV